MLKNESSHQIGKLYQKLTSTTTSFGFPGAKINYLNADLPKQLKKVVNVTSYFNILKFYILPTLLNTGLLEYENFDHTMKELIMDLTCNYSWCWVLTVVNMLFVVICVFIFCMLFNFINQYFYVYIFFNSKMCKCLTLIISENSYFCLSCQ